ncbi:MAG: pseudaminic acid biosynthesis-associated protein PseG, partial [Chitinophagaceae bacterium]|nr:pseudaminic acid biosynthesis-associated protein PseG [Chitinophagaceae bacterium]
PSIELKQTISKSVAGLITLKEYKSYFLEARYIATDIIPKYKIDIVTLDGYYFNTAYQKVIKKNANSILISVDDYQPFHYVSDVVINHAIGLNANQISREPYTKLFLGQKYFLVRKQLIQLLKEKKTISGIHSILICFGGADLNKNTLKALRAALNAYDFKMINLIIGSAFEHVSELEQITSQYSNIKVYNNVDTKAIVNLMRSCELAIVPASTIALESITAKLIILTGTTASNQKCIHNGIKTLKNVISIGSFNRITENLLKVQIKKIVNQFNKVVNFTAPIIYGDPVVDIYLSCYDKNSK